MTTEEIRNARKSFAAQLTSMIRDFERQTGKRIEAINVERDRYKPYPANTDGSKMSLFKGVYLAIE